MLFLDHGYVTNNREKQNNWSNGMYHVKVSSRGIEFANLLNLGLSEIEDLYGDVYNY